jgi:phosphatidylinositol-3-phosphatase
VSVCPRRSLLVAVLALALGPAATAAADPGQGGGRPVLPPGAIKHIMVVELENEDFSATFGPGSPATFLNGTLVPRGELLTNYFATGHASTDNYIAQVSGEAPNAVSGSDCISNTTTFVGTYNDVTPGTFDPDQQTYPGQVDGSGCVYPAAVKTIADQLDAVDPPNPLTHVAAWREYAEDMGNTPSRDGGVPDPLGGTDCGHPPAGGSDLTNSDTAVDSYADRHNPFMFFHSIVDDPALCDANVVPLGTLQAGSGGAPDRFSGHLATDLAHERTTPRFAFVTPSACDDGHDATCAGVNANGGKTGGLVAADAWLTHWMPLILSSPAYRDGHMLVVVTSDEANPFDPQGTNACCGERPGPSWEWPGYSQILSFFGVPAPTQPGQDPGGGDVGALLLNRKWIIRGTSDPTPYNHYSALRSYEDLLGLHAGGSDGRGHLGYAGQPGLVPFGADVFNGFARGDE